MISIIIPTFNEEQGLAELLTFLLKEAEGHDTEIIISDGGSSDHTGEIAKKYGVLFLSSPRTGRARQMNYGASKAKGEVLYFLHADTFPPEGFLNDIKKSLKKGFDAGCFQLGFDNNHPALQFFCWFTQFDVNLFRFGDQSLFTRKSTFAEAGGFSEHLLVMEDQEIVKKIKRKGSFGIINKAVKTSARKYEKNGIFKLQFIFTIIVMLYYLRVEQNTIAHFYKVSTY